MLINWGFALTKMFYVLPILQILHWLHFSLNNKQKEIVPQSKKKLRGQVKSSYKGAKKTQKLG